MRRIYYWIILIIIIYGFVELVSYCGLFIIQKYRRTTYKSFDVISPLHADITNKFIKQKTNYYSFSPTLGWSIKENGSSELYKANSSGFRGDREYDLTPPPGVRRISTFGDSFTHGDDVKNNETWQAIMESRDSNLEVINYGVGGYGLDQAYLRYLEVGIQYKPHFVLIGFSTENICRNVNTYRPFHNPTTGMPLAKPRFVIEDDRLSLIPSKMQGLHDYESLLRQPQDVLSKMGENDYHYKARYISSTFTWSPTVRLVKIAIKEIDRKLSEDEIIVKGRYNEKSEAFRITRKLFDEFHDASVKNGSTPIILIFPMESDVASYREKKEKRYAPLLSYFESRGYEYIDLMDVFENDDVAEMFVGHYSPVANRKVAECILDRLNDMGDRED